MTNNNISRDLYRVQNRYYIIPSENSAHLDDTAGFLGTFDFELTEEEIKAIIEDYNNE